MDNIIRLAGIVLMLLACLEAGSKKCKGFLPIGGTHIAQIAIVLGIAFAIFEIAAIIGNH